MSSDSNRRNQGRRRSAAARGVSLIEVMVSMGIFSIGILGILQLNIIAATQNGYAKRQSQAALIARDLIDGFERLPYTHPAFTAGSTDRLDNRFCDVTNATSELHSLDTTYSTDRPLLGASRQIALSDAYDANAASKSGYTVQWRVDTENEANGGRAHYICIMVRFKPPGSIRRQVNFFTVKHDPTNMAGNNTTNLEI